jgi:integrase
MRLPCFVTPEHFGIIYAQACDLAEKPTNGSSLSIAAGWWRALIVTAYMTGLRINEILSFTRSDLDLEKGLLITRWDDSKGKRDEVIPLHQVVVDHLRLIVGDRKQVFVWGHDRRELWDELVRIQHAAGIHLECRGKHKHTPACHTYGFHDFRRAFATVNAPRMKPEVLQKLMRHKSYQTTIASYINVTSQLEDAVKTMPVPDVLPKPKQPGPNNPQRSRRPEVSQHQLTSIGLSHREARTYHRKGDWW